MYSIFVTYKTHITNENAVKYANTVKYTIISYVLRKLKREILQTKF